MEFQESGAVKEEPCDDQLSQSTVVTARKERLFFIIHWNMFFHKYNKLKRFLKCYAHF